ncbi:MAG: ribonuclease R [Sphingomonadaceae bacterium]
MSKQHKSDLPSREKILDFITTSPVAAGKREIAKAFGLHGAEKIALKALLKDMADEGLIDSAPGRAFQMMGGLPKVTVLRVVDVEDDVVFAIPENWQAEGKPPPRLRVIERGKRGALGMGDRILARTEEAGSGYVAHPFKKLAKSEALVLGVIAKQGDRCWLKPVDKRERRETLISDLGEAAVGDLVLAELTGRAPRISARVSEILGDPFAPKAFSLIAIHKHGIPDVFGEDVLTEAERVATQPLGDREDLRHLPIVAIDPSDARDHDDAVWAQADDAGGFSAIVAIADVSFYVRPGSALDREARKRGNSVYFPDRVVPMLPENLSADMCSLVAGKDRAALACHLTINAQGKVTKFRFTRAVIRVAATIAYEDAQAAIDGAAHPLLESALKPLWACWALLAKARAKREPLDLDLPERRVVLDEAGRISSIAQRERLDAHRLIEDYMIAANVAAAKALEAKKAPCMYRVHEAPAREKLVALKDYLETFDVPFALGQVISPKVFNQLISRVGEADYKQQVMEQILRSQTQAYYAPVNQGHFGLSLGSYGHFTSPIRRYADLIVHRSLVSAYKLGDGGLSGDDGAKLGAVGTAISALERRAMEAERDTVDRYVAAFLSEKVGELLETRITGITGFGFFATVVGLGGDGLVPVSTLGAEYFRHDPARQVLVGSDTGMTYSVGQRLELRLAEANPISGALRFELAEGANHLAAKSPLNRKDRVRGKPEGRRGRPGNIRHQGRR